MEAAQRGGAGKHANGNGASANGNGNGAMNGNGASANGASAKGNGRASPPPTIAGTARVALTPGQPLTLPAALGTSPHLELQLTLEPPEALAEGVVSTIGFRLMLLGEKNELQLTLEPPAALVEGVVGVPLSSG